MNARRVEWPLAALGLVGVAFILLFLFVALSRISYPYEIEWMEGGLLTHAARLLEGLPIYAKPSADFVPYFYTPGYPMLIALLAKLTGGLSFTLARLISLFSTFVSMWILFQICVREVKKNHDHAFWYGLIGVGLYAALFRTNGAFYDLARPDSLILMLIASAVYIAYYHPTYVGAALSGVILAVGFWTKQTTSVFGPAIAIYLFVRNWRHAIVFCVSCFVPAALAVYFYNKTTDGWFWTFIFSGHQGHLFYWKNILMEYWRDVLFLAPILLCVPLLWFRYKVNIPILSLLLAVWWLYAFCFRAATLNYVPHMYYRELWYENPRFLILIPPALCALACFAYRVQHKAKTFTVAGHGYWLWMFVAAAGASGLNHSTQWAYSNCFMQLTYCASALIAIGLADLIEQQRGRWLMYAVVAIQFIALVYRPLVQMPRSEDFDALAGLENKLADIKGKVFFPAHPFYSYERDHEIHIHQMGIQDVAFMGGVQDLAKRIRSAEWGAILIDRENRVPYLEPAYYLAERLQYSSKRQLRTKTGFLTRPDTLWLPQDPTERLIDNKFTANFEAGEFTGWTKEGEFSLTTVHIEGQQGQWRTTSSQKGEGQLQSADFVLENRFVSALLMGGKGQLKAQVVCDGHTLDMEIPKKLDRIVVDAQACLGKKTHILLSDFDSNVSLTADDFRTFDFLSETKPTLAL